MRNNASDRKDLNKIKVNEFSIVNDVKGFLGLLTLPTFSIVWGILKMTLPHEIHRIQSIYCWSKVENLRVASKVVVLLSHISTRIDTRCSFTTLNCWWTVFLYCFRNRFLQLNCALVKKSCLFSLHNVNKCLAIQLWHLTNMACYT